MVWQEEKEEAWLNKMAEKGWFLKKYNLFYYEFEKRQSNQMIYKLDFQTNIPDISAYKKIFEEAGWEYVTSYINWHYFRGEKDEVHTEEIYTDKVSIKQKYIRIVKMLTVAVVFLFLSISYSLLTFSDHPFKGWAIFNVLSTLSVLLLLLYAIIKIRLKIKKVEDNVKLL